MRLLWGIRVLPAVAGILERVWMISYRNWYSTADFVEGWQDGKMAKIGVVFVMNGSTGCYIVE
jgi:hypothetical protein